MADEIGEVNPSDVTFFQTLKESKNSVLFKVAVRGRICVMKVVSGVYWLLIPLLSALSIMIEVHLSMIPHTAK